MKIVIFIILYLVGIIYVGAYLYKKQKKEFFPDSVEGIDLLIIVLLSIFFPITYIFGALMLIIKKIGDKL